MVGTRATVLALATVGFAYGLQVSGYQNPSLGVGLMALSAPALIWCALTWAHMPVMGTIPKGWRWWVIGLCMALSLCAVFTMAWPRQQGPAEAAQSAVPAMPPTIVPVAPVREKSAGPTAARDVEPQGPRVYVEKTLRQLVAMVEGLTFLEAERLTAPMIGKWLKVRGRVYDVSETLIPAGGLTVRIDDT